MVDERVTSRRDRSRSLAIEVGLVAFAAAVLYGSTLEGVFWEAHDGIWYINDIDRARDLFHPHHLLYGWGCRTWLDLCRDLGLGADSATLVRVLNVAFSAATLGLCWVFLRRRAGSRRLLAVWTCAMLGLSYAFWFYSVCVEVYAIPAFFTLVAFYLLCAPTLTSLAVVLAAVAHAMATLGHQTNGLFGICALCAIVMQAQPWRRRVGWACAYGVVYALVTGIPYVLVMTVAYESRSVADGLRWMTSYTHLGLWGRLSWVTPFAAVAGFGRAVFGGHFMFAIPGAARGLARVADKGFLHHQFLTRSLPVPAAWLLVGVMAAAIVATAAAVVAGLLEARRQQARPARWQVLALAWLVPYACFFGWWDPKNPQFWVQPLIPFWLLVGHCIPALVRGSRSLAGKLAYALPLLLFVVNFAGSIVFLRNPANDYYLHYVAVCARPTAADVVIAIGGANRWAEYFERYTPARIERLGNLGKIQDKRLPVRYLQRVIGQTIRSGGRVFFSPNTLHIAAEAKRHHPDHVYKEALLFFMPLFRDCARVWRTPVVDGETVHVLDVVPQWGADAGTGPSP